jgi:hypothetical protein
MNKGLKVIQTAIGQLGYTEDPPTSNCTKYGEWFFLNGYPWCAIFVSWVFDQAGLPLGKIDNPKGYAGCQGAYNFFKKNNLIISGKEAQAGDIVIYDWNGDAKMEHTGIFLQDNCDGIHFMAIEGNTSVDNNSNGGKVMIRNRKYSQTVFAHPTVLND